MASKNESVAAAATAAVTPVPPTPSALAAPTVRVPPPQTAPASTETRKASDRFMSAAKLVAKNLARHARDIAVEVKGDVAPTFGAHIDTIMRSTTLAEAKAASKAAASAAASTAWSSLRGALMKRMAAGSGGAPSRLSGGGSALVMDDDTEQRFMGNALEMAGSGRAASRLVRHLPPVITDEEHDLIVHTLNASHVTHRNMARFISTCMYTLANAPLSLLWAWYTASVPPRLRNVTPAEPLSRSHLLRALVAVRNLDDAALPTSDDAATEFAIVHGWLPADASRAELHHVWAAQAYAFAIVRARASPSDVLAVYVDAEEGGDDAAVTPLEREQAQWARMRVQAALVNTVPPFVPAHMHAPLLDWIQSVNNASRDASVAPNVPRAWAACWRRMVNSGVNEHVMDAVGNLYDVLTASPLFDATKVVLIMGAAAACTLSMEVMREVADTEVVERLEQQMTALAGTVQGALMDDEQQQQQQQQQQQPPREVGSLVDEGDAAATIESAQQHAQRALDVLTDAKRTIEDSVGVSSSVAGVASHVKKVAVEDDISDIEIEDVADAEGEDDEQQQQEEEEEEDEEEGEQEQEEEEEDEEERSTSPASPVAAAGAGATAGATAPPPPEAIKKVNELMDSFDEALLRFAERLQAEK